MTETFETLKNLMLDRGKNVTRAKLSDVSLAERGEFLELNVAITEDFEDMRDLWVRKKPL